MAEIKEKRPHAQLVVKTAGEPVVFGSGGGKKLQFACDDNISYATFNPSLFGSITAGVTLDADVEVRVNGEYTNYVVTQIYRDGNPVAGAKKWGGEGGGYRGKSPEETKAIADQVRIKAIVDLWGKDKLKDDAPLVKKMLAWLGELGSPVPQPVPAPQPVARPVAEQGVPSATLLTVSKEMGYDTANVTAIIVNRFKKAQASDLTTHERKTLLEILKAGKFKTPLLEEEVPF